jgi:hypothetical protein
MVTLLAAVGAFVSSGRSYALPTNAAIPLIFTLTALTVAAACGIIANRAVGREVVAIDTLRQMRTAHWADDEVDARNFLASITIDVIASLRGASNKKARWLLAGLGAQLCALAFLSMTVYLVLTEA